MMYRILSANWTFSLLCVPLIKSGSLNRPWSTNVLGQFLTRMCKFIDQSDVKKTHYVTDKNINVSSEGLDRHYQKFSSCPIGLSEILAIMSVSTFNIAVILYMYFPNTGLCRYFLLHSFQQLSWLWSVWRMWGHPRSSWPKPCVPENTTTCSST
jgi:hypothetical protein